jgi:hypothetical protein
MKTKTVLITIFPILIIIALMGGYFVYMDHSDRQRKKEIKRLIVQMQTEIQQATYNAKTKNKAEIVLKTGELRRKKAIDAAYKLREYSFDVYNKKHLEEYPNSKRSARINIYEEKDINSILGDLETQYKIKKYTKWDEDKRRFSWSQEDYNQFRKKLTAEANKERQAVIKEKLYNIRELKKENASHAKIIEIKDKYKNLIQKLETE